MTVVAQLGWIVVAFADMAIRPAVIAMLVYCVCRIAWPVGRPYCAEHEAHIGAGTVVATLAVPVGLYCALLGAFRGYLVRPEVTTLVSVVLALAFAAVGDPGRVGYLAGGVARGDVPGPGRRWRSTR